jgi:hypothetical protein
MPFNLRPEDERLIDAALVLGDWLAAHQGSTAEQVRIIRTLQTALRRLPDDSPDVYHAEYGFAFIPANSEEGACRSWIVSLWRHAPGSAGMIEIFNTYTTQPDRRLLEDAAHESHCFLTADTANLYLHDWCELIEELTDPAALMIEGDALEVEAETLQPGA